MKHQELLVCKSPHKGWAPLFPQLLTPSGHTVSEFAIFSLTTFRKCRCSFQVPQGQLMEPHRLTLTIKERILWHRSFQHFLHVIASPPPTKIMFVYLTKIDRWIHVGLCAKFIVSSLYNRFIMMIKLYTTGGNNRLWTYLKLPCKKRFKFFTETHFHLL